MSHSFAERMREDAALFERRGLKDTAALVRSYADELDGHQEAYSSELLTLDQAAEASGYHKDSLSRMMTEGTIPNAGKRGAPRIARRDLPKRAPRKPLPRTSSGGPALVRGALIDQGVLPAES